MIDFVYFYYALYHSIIILFMYYLLPLIFIIMYYLCIMNRQPVTWWSLTFAIALSYSKTFFVIKITIQNSTFLYSNAFWRNGKKWCGLSKPISGILKYHSLLWFLIIICDFLLRVYTFLMKAEYLEMKFFYKMILLNIILFEFPWRKKIAVCLACHVGNLHTYNWSHYKEVFISNWIVVDLWKSEYQQPWRSLACPLESQSCSEVRRGDKEWSKKFDVVVFRLALDGSA